MPKSIQVLKLLRSNFNRILRFNRIKRVYIDAAFKKKFTLYTRQPENLFEKKSKIYEDFLESKLNDSQIEIKKNLLNLQKFLNQSVSYAHNIDDSEERIINKSLSSFNSSLERFFKTFNQMKSNLRYQVIKKR